MKLEQSFDVDAPIADVWEALTDVQRVAPCLPGAEVSESEDDGTYHGTFTVKLGPTTASYRGSLKMVELDESSHTATMQADGQDKRGQGGAKATIVSRMSEAEGSTRVEVETDFTITGRLARFGRGGMIQDVSNRLMAQFAECLQTQLARGNGAAAEAAAPVEEGDAGEPEAGSENGASAAPAAEEEDAPTEVMASPAAAQPPADAGGAEPDPEVARQEQEAAASTPPTPAEPLDAGALMADIARDRARRNAPVIIGALVLLLLLLRRRRG